MKKISILTAFLLPAFAFAAPVAPSELVLESKEGSVTVKWHDNAYHEKGYKVYRDGTLIRTTKANVEEYVDTNIEPNHTYTYEVRSFGDDYRLARDEISGEDSDKAGKINLVKLGSNEEILSSKEVNLNSGYWKYKRLGDFVYLYPQGLRNSEDSFFYTIVYKIDNNKLTYIDTYEYAKSYGSALYSDHLDSSYFDTVVAGGNREVVIFRANSQGKIKKQIIDDMRWAGSLMSDKFDSEIVFGKGIENFDSDKKSNFVASIKMNGEGEKASVKKFYFDNVAEILKDDTVMPLGDDRILVVTDIEYDETQPINLYVLKVANDGTMTKLAKSSIDKSEYSWIRRADHNLLYQARSSDKKFVLRKVKDDGKIVTLGEIALEPDQANVFGINFSHSSNEIIFNDNDFIYNAKIEGDSLNLVQKLKAAADIFDDTKHKKVFSYECANGQLIMFDRKVDENQHTILEKSAEGVAYKDGHGCPYGEISDIRIQGDYVIAYQGATGPRFDREAPIEYKATVYEIDENNKIKLLKHNAYKYNGYAHTEPKVIPSSVLDNL